MVITIDIYKNTRIIKNPYGSQVFLALNFAKNVEILLDVEAVIRQDGQTPHLLIFLHIFHDYFFSCWIPSFRHQFQQLLSNNFYV